MKIERGAKMTDEKLTAIAFEKDPAKRNAMIDEMNVSYAKPGMPISR